jgi:rare lipoprotein A
MRLRAVRVALGIAALALLAACGSTPRKPSASASQKVTTPQQPAAASARRKSPYAPAQEDPNKRGNYTRGGLYAPEIQDSAPDGIVDVDQIPEPEVTSEPRSLYGNRSPYVVLGKTYTVLDDPSRYDEVGLASFYGNKFHGRRTSNLEVYDMYAFTAAHKTLPLPSFARVTNLANGKSVIVRVNDRGPFHDGRIIDLSYAAAVKLGVDRAGTARVEVRGLSPGETPASDPVADRGNRATPASIPAPKPTSTPATTAIDHLVAALPIANADAAVPAHAAATSARFDMRQDGRTMSADEFDRWMRERQMHVATGKPTTVPTSPAATEATVPATAPVVASGPSAGAVDDDAWTLQVASFAARANAEHALAMLSGAGISGARLLDADANGRRVWRLRVGPVAATAAPELIGRIQGLGFGQPQRVRE